MFSVLISGKLAKAPKIGTSANGNKWTSASVRCPVQGNKEGEPDSVLAAKHGVSNGFVAKNVKGVAQDTATLVSAGIEYRKGLAAIDERSMTAVVTAVDERTRHIQFFNNATVKNISTMMAKVGDDTPIAEHRLAQSAIKDERETVLGKQPDTAIQINNNTATTVTIPDDPIQASLEYIRFMSGND